jgi:hypothetical protein
MHQLWAIMLRNSTETFISQSTSRKFLDTLEDLLSSSKTSPVVRERLLEVVAAAAYASGKSESSFSLMRCVDADEADIQTKIRDTSAMGSRAFGNG